jgi:hypothetical protein
MRRVLFIFIFAALVSVPQAAWPQGTPLGPEFRINSYTTNEQSGPSVASDASGNFVIAWVSAQDPGYGVFAQRYAASGAPLGLEFRVNTYTTGAQGLLDVGSDPSGNFVVAWTSIGQDGSTYGIFGQRFATSGAPLGPEFRVNSYTTGGQGYPSIAADSAGNFVIVWESGGQDGSSYGAFGQRYNSSGAPLGPEFRVNTYTTGPQYDPRVASDSAGNFIVVWSSNQDGSADGIFGQRYASSGAPVGLEFRVNTYTTSGQHFPAVASDSSGNFVVVWSSQFQDGSADGVFGQRYASSGAPVGPEFRVNVFTTNYQSRPDVSSDASGDFVVVWNSDLQDGSLTGVFGQRYANTGAPLGPEFRVNTYTTNDQQSPTVAAAATAGTFVVAWEGDLEDGSGYGVFGQRYSQIVPVELMHFRVE